MDKAPRRDVMEEADVNLPDRVEDLIMLLVDGNWGDADWPDVRRLGKENYLPDLDLAIPYPWMLCTKRLPQARNALRHVVADMRGTLDSLETFLDTIDAAEEEATAQGYPDWAPLIALLKAPFPLRKPVVFDPREPFNIAVMARDMLHGGDWDEKSAWIDTQGSLRQRLFDASTAQSLREFERRYGVNLSDLLFSERDRAEHEQMREQYAQHPLDEDCWSPADG